MVTFGRKIKLFNFPTKKTHVPNLGDYQGYFLAGVQIKAGLKANS